MAMSSLSATAAAPVVRFAVRPRESRSHTGRDPEVSLWICVDMKVAGHPTCGSQIALIERELEQPDEFTASKVASSSTSASANTKGARDCALRGHAVFLERAETFNGIT